MKNDCDICFSRSDRQRMLQSLTQHIRSSPARKMNQASLSFPLPLLLLFILYPKDQLHTPTMLTSTMPPPPHHDITPRTTNPTELKHSKITPLYGLSFDYAPCHPFCYHHHCHCHCCLSHYPPCDYTHIILRSM